MKVYSKPNLYFLKGSDHFQNNNFLIIYSPHVIQDVRVFLSSVAKKLMFLRKTFQDCSLCSGLQWWPTGWNSKFFFFVQLQRLYMIPVEELSVLSTETFGHFLKTIKMYILFKEVLTQCLQSEHAKKVKRPLQKRSNNDVGWFWRRKEEKMRWSFSPYSTFLNWSTQTKN